MWAGPLWDIDEIENIMLPNRLILRNVSSSPFFISLYLLYNVTENKNNHMQLYSELKTTSIINRRKLTGWTLIRRTEIEHTIYYNIIIIDMK